MHSSIGSLTHKCTFLALYNTPAVADEMLPGPGGCSEKQTYQQNNDHNDYNSINDEEEEKYYYQLIN